MLDCFLDTISNVLEYNSTKDWTDLLLYCCTIISRPKSSPSEHPRKASSYWSHFYSSAYSWFTLLGFHSETRRSEVKKGNISGAIRVLTDEETELLSLERRPRSTPGETFRELTVCHAWWSFFPKANPYFDGWTRVDSVEFPCWIKWSWNWPFGSVCFSSFFSFGLLSSVFILWPHV